MFRAAAEATIRCKQRGGAGSVVGKHTGPIAIQSWLLGATDIQWTSRGLRLEIVARSSGVGTAIAHSREGVISRSDNSMTEKS
jgi:hypothetical protein